MIISREIDSRFFLSFSYKTRIKSRVVKLIIDKSCLFHWDTIPLELDLRKYIILFLHITLIFRNSKIFLDNKIGRIESKNITIWKTKQYKIISSLFVVVLKDLKISWFDWVVLMETFQILGIILSNFKKKHWKILGAK